MKRIAEAAVFLPQWPAGFDELVGCWRKFRDGGHAAERPRERDYFALFELAGRRPPRLYFGNEFCEHRIPGRAELAAVVTAAAEAGFAPTLATPPCGEAGLDRVAQRCRELEQLAPGAEVVVNDWGVLSLVSERHRLTPVLGRLMARFLRDPRVTPRYRRPDAPPAALKALQQCSLSLPEFQDILSAHGVRRVELDFLYQGIGVDFRGLRLRPSLYIPYGYVTTGRICLFAGLNRPREPGFALHDGCDRPCRNLEAALVDPAAPEGGAVRRFWQRGNTIFYRQNGPMVSAAVAWANQQRARLVFQPELPF